MANTPLSNTSLGEPHFKDKGEAPRRTLESIYPPSHKSFSDLEQGTLALEGEHGTTRRGCKWVKQGEQTS